MSRRYSDVVITDDNCDEELEKLCDLLQIPYGCMSFVKEIDDGFSKQINDDLDCEEWVKVKIEPNYAIDCVTAIENYSMAYEFGNGFMCYTERDSLWD